MKRLIGILICLIALFLYLWGYKLRQPLGSVTINAPQSSLVSSSPIDESQFANSQQSTPEPSSAVIQAEDAAGGEVPQDASSSTPVSQSAAQEEIEGNVTKEIVEQEIKDGDYTVKQQFVVTRTFDETGELISTHKSDPVEIERWRT